MKKETTPIVVKRPTKQKLIVEQGRVLMGEPVEYKVLYTEVVPDKETAKKREQELKEEYKDTEAVSVHYFSL